MPDEPAMAGEPLPLLITDRYEAAMLYATKYDWAVLPIHTWHKGKCTCGNPRCDRPAKHPMTRKGVHDASKIPATITGWWTQLRGYPNVGVATGTISDIFSLDADLKSGGLDTLAEWQQKYGPLARTRTMKTGGGGLQKVYRLPSGLIIPSRVGLAPGIDVRGEGSYFLAPPSAHASGGVYGWDGEDGEDANEADAYVIDLILNPKPKVQVTVVTPAVAVTNPMVMMLSAGTPDLRTSPGAGEGQRHDTLCRLAGVHLARGEDPVRVETDAQAWNKTCVPPMDAAEVTRTVKSLAAKHAGTTATAVAVVQTIPATVADDDEDVPLPVTTPWPVLHADALHGWTGDFIRAVAPHTEADAVGVLSSTFVAVGNCIGRKARFAVEGDFHHVNFFVANVGESSRGRKGTSLSRTMNMLQHLDPDWYAHRVMSGLSSGEGLIWQVRDAITAMEPIKEKGVVTRCEEVVKDPGITDKRLFVTETEFAQVLRVLRREGNTLSAIIRQAWDRGNLSSLTKNNPAKATDAHVSVLAHVTLGELTKYLDDTDVFNGFANRFLWVLVRRSQLLPFGGEGVDLAPLQARLAEVVARARAVTDMTRSTAARDLWREVYPELTAERPGLYGAVTGRAEAQTLRLSMLYALLDGQPVIDVPHLNAALAFWRYCDESAKIIFGKADAGGGDALEQQLLALIRQTPGVNRRGLHQALGGHVTATALVAALAKLRDRGQARCEKVATGGRPGECWFLPGPATPS
jgi:hypothetical protein